MTVGRVNLRGQSVLLDTKTLDLRMQARKLTSRFVVCRAFQGVGTVEPPHNHRPANPNCVYLRIDATHAHHPSLPQYIDTAQYIPYDLKYNNDPIRYFVSVVSCFVLRRRCCGRTRV